MPNIANLLKQEIARVAKKQVRAETAGLKQAIAPYRAQIADLKRRTRQLEQQVNRLSRVTARVAATGSGSSTPDSAGPNLRFSAKGLAAQRKRLGLSAQAFGALIGASGQSVYKWEEGSTRPRAKNLPAIAALRTMGKKEAAARLEALAG